MRNETEKNSGMQPYFQTVLVFDVCSSTTIVERLSTSGSPQRWIELLQGLRKYLKNNEAKYNYEIYKFTGDGWILLFKQNDIEIDLKHITLLIPELINEYKDLYRTKCIKTNLHIEQKPYTETDTETDTETGIVTGLTFGVDHGIVSHCMIGEMDERIGVPINVACRLQSEVKNIKKILGTVGYNINLTYENKGLIHYSYYESYSTLFNKHWLCLPVDVPLRNVSLRLPKQCLLIDLKQHFVSGASLEAPETRLLWFLLKRSVTTQLLAVNYLSHEEWDKFNGADYLKQLEDITNEYPIAQIQRIFVLDNNDEYNQWAETFKKHAKFECKYILKTDYDIIQRENNNPTLKNTSGFNIVDPDTNGFVCCWEYKDRVAVGSIYYKDIAIAQDYTVLFYKVWGKARGLQTDQCLEA